MADKRIQDLPEIESVKPNDLIVVASEEDGYNAKKVTGTTLSIFIEGSSGSYAQQAKEFAEIAKTASAEATTAIETIKNYRDETESFSTTASDSANKATHAATETETNATKAETAQAAAESAKTAAESAVKSAEQFSTSADEAKEAAIAAQQAAEKAASEVSAIVAGNEAYTKQESNDRFALALKTTDGPSTSLTIYPDQGSNMVIIAHGYTTQEGDGDPSPENVRPIKTGGIRLVKKVFDGSENWWTTPAGTSGLFRVGTDIEGLLMPASSAVPKSKCDRYPVLSAEQTINQTPGLSHASTIPAIHIYDPEYNTSGKLTAWKEHLAQNPLTVWLEMEDGSGKLYASVVTEGNRYHCECLPLSTYLCQGNSISSEGREVITSKLVKLEPSGWTISSQDDSGTWFINYTLNNSIWQTPSKPNDRLCTHFPLGTASGSVLNKTNIFSLGNGGGNINLKFLPGDISTVEALNQFLIENEVYVWGVLNSLEENTYDPVQFISLPIEDGSVTISSENTVSATYNKSIVRAFQELQTTLTELKGET